MDAIHVKVAAQTAPTFKDYENVQVKSKNFLILIFHIGYGRYFLTLYKYESLLTK